MLGDDGNIPPNLRRVPDDPHWRYGAQLSKAKRVDNSLAVIAAEGAASGRHTALNAETDSPETAPRSTAWAVVPVNSEPVPQDAQTDLYCRAAECWDHLKQTERETWGHYIIIGEAMVVARAEIMRKLGRNDPTGPAYQREFKAWLVKYGLADMDKGARARLIRLIDALPEVDEMLSGWSDQDRRKRNHPNTIYRELVKWRVAHGQLTETRAKKTTGTSRKELLQENERLRAHIADIEPARECETVSAASTTDAREPTDIVIEANRSADIEIVGRFRKKMTPSAARRDAEGAQRKSHERLERAVFRISCACENTEELELPTLTAAERDGHLEKNADGKLAITRVELRPKITWGDDRKPSAEELDKMHHAAHENCFITNSVKTEVRVTKVY